MKTISNKKLNVSESGSESVSEKSSISAQARRLRKKKKEKEVFVVAPTPVANNINLFGSSTGSDALDVNDDGAPYTNK